MRITNTMLANNAMLNMTKNKQAYNKYFQQFTSTKKIQRPSDDPVVAVRSLKFRTRITELEQYLEKNVPDAISWTEATDSILSTIDSTLTKMFDYCQQAANGPTTTSDRGAIKEVLKAFVENIFEENANSDNAGRYLFTGYRTDVPLLFDKDTDHLTYTINEKLTATDINPFSYVYGGMNYSAIASAGTYALNAPDFQSTHIMRLSYDNLDSGFDDVTITYTDSAGNPQTIEPPQMIVKSVANDTIYNEHYKPGADEVYVIPETGELVFGDNVYASISESKDINVKYQKTDFKKNEIRPEHYFNCTAKNNLTSTEINYSNPESQAINYQINFSQTLKVNTLACDAIDSSIRRSVDHIINVINDISVSEAALNDVEKRITDCDPAATTTLEALNQLKQQINNKIKMQETMLTDAYTSAMTTCKTAQNTLGVAWSELGARMNRLDSTKAKLEEQAINFENALADNEEVDMEEAYTRYNQADLLYQATLQATSKTLGKSLLDFL